MEENKSKKSEGVSLVLVIAILVIVLAGCITYIVKINENELTINNDNNAKTVSELKAEIANLKSTLEQEKNKLNIVEVNSIKKKLDVIFGLEFSDSSKLSNEDIYSRVRFYLEKEGIIKHSETGKEEIKRLIKEIFNIDYKGSFKILEIGSGETTFDTAILNIEKQNQLYKVNYALIARIDADTEDSVRTYYDAEIAITEEGNMYIKSNIINKNMTKNLD